MNVYEQVTVAGASQVISAAKKDYIHSHQDIVLLFHQRGSDTQ